MVGKNGQGKVALVTGATGVTGRHCVDALLKRDQEWKVVTLARRDLDLGDDKKAAAAVKQVKTDLLDKNAIKSALKDAGCQHVTHIFHCAYLMKKDPKEEADINLAMLRNTVEGAEAAGARLQHVYTMEGGKWYGQHLNTFLKTPHREDDPRIMPPMFYYDLEGYLEQRVKDGASFSWSALRPNPVCGFSTGSFMNLTVSLAVFASMSKEVGIPLRWPGSTFAWNALQDVCDASLLAEAMVHLATTPACANQAFNISNGDTFRYKDLWPTIAKEFGMDTAPNVSMKLTQMMSTPDKKELWASMVKKYGLKDIPYDHLVTWEFADFCFNLPSEWFSTVTKLARTGFHGQCIDTDVMFARQFKELRQMKIIP